MRKFTKSAAALALTLAMGTAVLAGVPAFAEAAAVKTTCRYVDANKDGICDNYAERKDCAYVDADKDGICDNYDGTKGCAFVDKNKDGICDNYEEHKESCRNVKKNNCKKASGRHHSGGRGRGHGHGRHHS